MKNHNQSDHPLHEEKRIVLKLHGTNKPHRINILEHCFTGQHVFIIYDAKRTRCFVYTEEGEEIGRLSKRDSQLFAEKYDACIHSTYITKIQKQDERFRVKLLLIIAADQPLLFQ